MVIRQKRTSRPTCGAGILASRYSGLSTQESDIPPATSWITRAFQSLPLPFRRNIPGMRHQDRRPGPCQELHLPPLARKVAGPRDRARDVAISSY